jgi:hypothetical protein
VEPDAANQPAPSAAKSIQSILDRWGLTIDDLTKIVDANPSLRGMMLGYAAEYVLRRRHFTDSRLTGIVKDDDHDRDSKGDLRFEYRGMSFRIECKSLQSNSIKNLGDGKFEGKYQCDASDRRPVTFDDSSSIETTCLLVGEFDIVAVNLFSFTNEWRFAFALNKDLPRSRFKKYTPYQRDRLLSSTMPITWPIVWPYVLDPFPLLDLVVDGKISLPKQV